MSTPSDKLPSFESYVKEPERPPVPIDVKHKFNFQISASTSKFTFPPPPMSPKHTKMLLQSGISGFPDNSLTDLAKFPIQMSLSFL